MHQTPLCINPRYRLEVVYEDNVAILLDEVCSLMIMDAYALRLLSLIDGKRSLSDLVTLLEPEVDTQGVATLVAQLMEKDVILLTEVERYE